MHGRAAQAGSVVVGSLFPHGVEDHVRESTRRIVRDCQAMGHPVRNVWGFNPARDSDHKNRRCVDLMIYTKEDGDWIADYLIRYRTQLHLKYVIWYGRQWRDYHKPGITRRRWVPYFGRHRHRDHLHLEFYES